MSFVVHIVRFKLLQSVKDNMAGLPAEAWLYELANYDVDN